MSTQTGGVIPQFDLGDRLRKARELTGQTVREFAEHTGISKNTISNYETGKTERVRRPMLVAWAMATGVPVQWLETGEAPQPDLPDGTPRAGVRRQGLEPRTQWFRASTLELVAA